MSVVNLHQDQMVLWLVIKFVLIVQGVYLLPPLCDFEYMLFEQPFLDFILSKEVRQLKHWKI